MPRTVADPVQLPLFIYSTYRLKRWRYIGIIPGIYLSQSDAHALRDASARTPGPRLFATLELIYDHLTA